MVDGVVDVLVLVWINVLLSGDNALVIAMATRHLPPSQRRKAAVAGAAAAVVMRVVLTAAASRVLYQPYIQAVAGFVLIWIAIRLLSEDEKSKKNGDSASWGSDRWWKAIWTIVVADVTMSVDNVLAIATAARGNLALLTAGLGLSIPVIVWGSGLVRWLLERASWLLYAGAGVLGWIAGGMVAEDPAFRIGTWVPAGSWWAAGLTACAVLAVGLWRRRVQD